MHLSRSFAEIRGRKFVVRRVATFATRMRGKVPVPPVHALSIRQGCGAARQPTSVPVAPGKYMLPS